MHASEVNLNNTVINAERPKDVVNAWMREVYSFFPSLIRVDPIAFENVWWIWTSLKFDGREGSLSKCQEVVMGKLQKALRAQLSKKPDKKDKGDALKGVQDKQKMKKPSGPIRVPAKHKTLSLFNDNDKILLVGEGNFSFARSLCDILGPKVLIATCYDSEETLKEKYPESTENIEAITLAEGKVMYGIDAKGAYKASAAKGEEVFKDRLQLSACRKSARHFLEPDGEILLTLRSGQPYDSWDVKPLAKSVGLATKTTTIFTPDDFPGYAHRRTIGFDEKISSDANEDILRSKCHTYVFVLKAAADKLMAAQIANKKGDESE
ncbi:hypothetical protein BC829DRAFT_444048 [Chytridium lagenaria]|nr:hypothetical protein BC829DRAFT_444048 [Chytridium lagenaria]